MSLKSALVNLRAVTALERFNSNIAESLRLVSMQLILVPAAYLLPKSWALALAKLLSLPLIVFPAPGIITYLRMREAFGEGLFRTFRLTWGWVGRPFRDFVILKRVLYGREDISKWKIVEKNSDAVARLRESGQSFIVATAHFEREALLPMACSRVTPGNLMTVAHPPPKEIKTLYDLRLRIQYGTMLKVLSTAWRRPFEFAFTMPRTSSSQSAASMIFDRLRKRGNVLLIHVDAPWTTGPKGGRYTRPFAGLRGREFSTGAAQLAELTQRPIVSCIYWQKDDETVVLEWGSPIQRVDDTIETMNRLIDPLEVAIGERPTHYVLNIGDERRWNATLKRWEDLAA